jgi:two-component system, NarL family, sensor histidine kinase LiaS
MHKHRSPRFFRRLGGKLTLSYTLTSVASFLLAEIVVIIIVFRLIDVEAANLVLNNLEQEAPQAAPYVIAGTSDQKVLTSLLYTIDEKVSREPIINQPISLSVLNRQGVTLASIGTHPSMLILTQLSPQNRANFQKVLSASDGTTGLLGQEADGTQLAMAPIEDEHGQIQGVLIMHVSQPDMFALMNAFLHFVVVTVIIVTIIAGITGLIFGYLNARGITKRLQSLSIAAERWSSGDFSALTHDTSEDEVGQLARQLDLMSKQLQNLLQTKQTLATLEARNRLARDLHDSVKQQIFAIAMNIGTTQSLLNHDLEAARTSLKETSKLVTMTQQELTSLIRELRPAALNGKNIATALRELVTAWAQQTGIVATASIEVQQPLPLTVEEAFFRVAQEALSNVARHSKATQVQVALAADHDGATLVMIDNGQGFTKGDHDGSGLGLHSMRERMKILGGDVQIESVLGAGTKISARYNYQNKSAAPLLLSPNGLYRDME